MTPEERQTRLHREVARFRKWATPQTRRYGEWEVTYPHWDALYEAFGAMLDDNEPEAWRAKVNEWMLYALARNNEIMLLKRKLTASPRHLMALARAGLSSAETQARWQLAAALGHAGAAAESIALLERYIEDTDEYVRRRALTSLGRRGAPNIEAHVRHAWDSGEQYQRMAALAALHYSGSAALESYLTRTEADGREYLVGIAQRIRAGETEL